MQKVVIILGPTASGKTNLAIHLATAFDGEIISADSRQVYQGLDIGSGKVTKREMRGVPHHLLDVAHPRSVYSASEYVKDGRRALSSIQKRGKNALIAGGTGFYIDALLGTITLPDVKPNVKLRKSLAQLSLGDLQKTLKALDPDRYETIDTHNPVRLIRAIEIAKAAGKNSPTKSEILYEPLYIGIRWDSDSLKARIHGRLLKRISGILRETKQLHEKGLSWKRMEELGLEYRYAARYHRGLLDKRTMLEELEREIVRYAKRQMTWFKRNRDIHWIDSSKLDSVEDIVRRFLS